MFASKYQRDSGESPGFLFIKTYNQWYGKIQKTLKTIELTHPQFVLLAVLAYLTHQGIQPTQKMIASHASMDVMTTSQVLRLLEKKEYIKRQPHPVDTRANMICLLPAGEKKINAAIPLIEKVDTAYFGALGADLSGFTELLRRLVNA